MRFILCELFVFANAMNFNAVKLTTARATGGWKKQNKKKKNEEKYFCTQKLFYNMGCFTGKWRVFIYEPLFWKRILTSVEYVQMIGLVGLHYS